MKIKIQKSVVCAKNKTLNSKYTFEQPQDIKGLTPVDVYDEIADTIAEEINKEILSELYTSMGWITVGYEGPEVEVSAWLRANCKDSYFQTDSFCQFVSEADATMFTLSWT